MFSITKYINAQANDLISDMATDSLGLIRCGEIIRVVKSWLYRVKKEKAFWELVADSALNLVKPVENYYSRLRDFLKSMDRTGRNKDNISVFDKQKDDQDCNSKQHSQMANSGDHEIHHTVQIRIASSSLVQVIDRGLDDHFKFRIGIHPPSNGHDNNQHNDSDYIAEDEEPPMTLAAEFSLKSDMNGLGLIHEANGITVANI